MQNYCWDFNSNCSHQCSWNFVKLRMSYFFFAFPAQNGKEKARFVARGNFKDSHDVIWKPADHKFCRKQSWPCPPLSNLVWFEPFQANWYDLIFITWERNCIDYCERENKLRRYLLNISFLTSYTHTPFVFMKTSTTFSVFVFRNKLRRKKTSVVIINGIGNQFGRRGQFGGKSKSQKFDQF